MPLRSTPPRFPRVSSVQLISRVCSAISARPIQPVLRHRICRGKLVTWWISPSHSTAQLEMGLRISPKSL